MPILIDTQRRLIGSGDGPLLVGAAAAGPDLQRRTVGRAVAGGIQALARTGVDQLGAAARPLLRIGAVAVVELDRRSVGRTRGGHVHALAQSTDGTVGADGP